MIEEVSPKDRETFLRDLFADNEGWFQVPFPNLKRIQLEVAIEAWERAGYKTDLRGKELWVTKR